MEVVLFQPEIPQNTGNIVRTCAATGASLKLVKPLGFSTSNRQLKRAGLDYWLGVDVEEIDDLDLYLSELLCQVFFFSSKASVPYTSAPFTEDSVLVFGSETSGLPPRFLKKYPDRFYTIPMRKEARCLNLSNSAAIVLYEALRQNHFSALNTRDRKNDMTRLTRSEVARGK